MFLRILQNSEENISFGKHQSFNEVVGRRPQAYYFIKNETPAKVEICKILKNTCFIEQMWRMFLNISEY